jgi:hypothetical protein
MRVVVQNNPGHPDNLGYIVTHLGMNLDARFQEFKDFENDDKAFWDKVIGGEEPEVPQAVLDGMTRLRAGDQVVVHDEIVDSLWEEDFTSPEDQQIVEDLRERFKLLGLDDSKIEEMVRMAQQAPVRKLSPSEPFAVQPQRDWEEARKRLNEETKRLATVVLNHVELTPAGTELIYKYKSLKLTGRSNFIAALTMVNHEINKRLGKDRKAASIEEFKSVLDNLDDVIQTLAKRVRMARSMYEKENS